MTATTYRTDGNRQICDRHHESWTKGGGCVGCVTDPGAPLEDVEPEVAAPPDGCLSTLDVERQYVVDAAELLGLIRRLTGRTSGRTPERGELEGENPLGLKAMNTVVKLYDARTKVLRQIAACAARREDEAVVTRREKEKRELERGAAH